MSALTVLIPTLDEEGNIEELIANARKHAQSIVPETEILVVDGGSADRTREFAEKAGAVVVRQAAPGYGAALREGFARASGEFILTLDADLSHPLDFFPKFWERRADADLIVASRLVPGGGATMPLSRRILSRILNWGFGLLFGLPIRDQSSGFRLYRAAVVKGLKLEARDFDVLQEILIKLHQKGVRMLELPFHYEPRKSGSSKARLMRFGRSYWRTINALWPDDFDAKPWLAAILGGSLLLRLAGLVYWNIFLNDGSVYRINPYDDYLTRARALLGGVNMGVEEIFRPPAYTYFLLGFLKAFGERLILIQLVQCAMAAAVGYFIYRLAVRWSGRRVFGLAAAAFWSVNIFSIYFAPHIMSENLFVFLLVALFAAWEAAVAARSLPGALGVGLLAGVVCVTRWQLLGFLPFFGLLEAWRLGRKDGAKAAVLVLACALGAATVVGAWGLRNQRKHGRFALAGPQKGWNFYEGLTLDVDEQYRRPYWMGDEQKALGLDKDLFKADEYFWAKGWAELAQNPAQAALIVGGKALKFWRLAPYPPHPRFFRWAAGAFYFVLFTFALYGAVYAARRGSWIWGVVLWIAYVWALHTLFFSGIRYRFPLDPFFSVLAGVGLGAFVRGEDA